MNYVGQVILEDMTNSLDVDELIKQLLKVKQTGKQVRELIYLKVTLYQFDLFFITFKNDPLEHASKYRR